MHPDGTPRLLFYLYFGAILGPPLMFFVWKCWKHKASEHWPKVAAAFNDGKLKIGTKRGKRYYVVAVTFTYQIAGRTFHGEYEKGLSGYSETEANQLLKSLREGPLYVRYRSSKPDDYVCDPFRDVRP